MQRSNRGWKVRNGNKGRELLPLTVDPSWDSITNNSWYKKMISSITKMPKTDIYEVGTSPFGMVRFSDDEYIPCTVVRLRVQKPHQFCSLSFKHICFTLPQKLEPFVGDDCVHSL